ncbi:DME family drug/metabolite transporter [Variovorax boronicumulans]|uniref:DMT family transporter n=1 Tax=Variovorax boronicumulans TaxID=436515 RepID=UPI002785032A|nr:DMT family transporter [Variovorax boronicumulans]MDP9992177.1 DME family drug/metabolite transporter [Variovorax boronicumulans]MDQ0002072.1 DME family drug/metabolite transporter [Variovorax boronicumulans]
MSAALAWGGVLLAGALWGGGALVAQFLIDGGIAPQSLSLARFALGVPLLWWLHWRAQRVAEATDARWHDLARREQFQVVGTGAAMALNVSCWFAGIAHLGAALPTVISICCAPVIVALVSVARGYEPFGLRLLGGLVLALAGVALLVMPAKGWGPLPAGHAAGLAWSFGSAFCYALVVLGNARMPVRVPAVTASAWGMSVAALCMLAVAWPSGITWPSGAAQWLGAAYTGVVTTSVAYLAFAWGARRLSPTAAVVGTLIEPLVAALLAALLFAEPMAPRQWLGAVLLAVAMLLLMRRGAKTAPETEADRNQK